MLHLQLRMVRIHKSSASQLPPRTPADPEPLPDPKEPPDAFEIAVTGAKVDGLNAPAFVIESLTDRTTLRRASFRRQESQEHIESEES